MLQVVDSISYALSDIPALSHLASFSVIHRDVAMRNFLVSLEDYGKKIIKLSGEFIRPS